MARTFAVIASILMMLGMSAVAQDAAKNGPASTPESTVRIDGEAELETSVGMNASIRSVFLDGTELEVKKVDPRTAAVRLRIDQSYPHGDGFRYDLTWMAMEPGPHNLIDYLSRKDGSDVTSLPPITVTAQSVLPSDRVLPNALSKSPSISAGGYRTTLLVGSVVWLVGLGFLLRWWWQDRPKLGRSLRNLRRLVCNNWKHSFCRLHDILIRCRRRPRLSLKVRSWRSGETKSN